MNIIRVIARLPVDVVFGYQPAEPQHGIQRAAIEIERVLIGANALDITEEMTADDMRCIEFAIWEAKE